MRVGKDFLRALGPSEPPASAGAPAAGSAERPTALLPALKRACPSLWARAHDSKLSRREQHQRMVDLLAWLASKHGAQAFMNVRRSYETEDRRVDGRVDLRLVAPHERALEIEVCLVASAASVHKLLAAHHDGVQALMVCGFASTADDALSRLQKTVALKHWGWLALAFTTSSRPAN